MTKTPGSPNSTHCDATVTARQTAARQAMAAGLAMAQHKAAPKPNVPSTLTSDGSPRAQMEGSTDTAHHRASLLAVRAARAARSPSRARFNASTRANSGKAMRPSANTQVSWPQPSRCRPKWSRNMDASAIHLSASSWPSLKPTDRKLAASYDMMPVRERLGAFAYGLRKFGTFRFRQLSVIPELVGSRLAARPRAARLHRRAALRAIRAEHAAVPRLGPQQRGAALALVKPLAGIERHPFGLGMSTDGTGQHRFQAVSCVIRAAIIRECVSSWASRC